MEEADLMLSELAVRGHLEVTVEHDRLVYAPMRSLALWRDPGLMVLSPKSTIRDEGDGQHA